jgi:hypothetical protein
VKEAFKEDNAVVMPLKEGIIKNGGEGKEE